MGNWLHLLYDRQKGVLWRNILPVTVLVIIFSFLAGAVAGVGGLSVPAIKKFLSGMFLREETSKQSAQQNVPISPQGAPPLGVTMLTSANQSGIVRPFALKDEFAGTWVTIDLKGHFRLTDRLVVG